MSGALVLPPNYKLVLASQSPRRRELLSRLGHAFEVVLPDTSAEPEDAAPASHESIADFVLRLAISKANSVACRLDYPALVIGCDTVADLDGEALGKPRDRDDAQRMLRMLSGRRHSVWSGLCLIDSLDQRRWADRAESQLVMTELSEQDLQAYLDSQAWKGKSGAFGFQDGPSWLTLVSGTAENVVGLPIDLLNQLIVKASGSR